MISKSLLGYCCFSVGKSCIADRLAYDRFDAKHDLTIGVEFYKKLFDIDGKRIKLVIWDLAVSSSKRQYQFTLLRVKKVFGNSGMRINIENFFIFRSTSRSYYAAVDIVIICADLTRVDTITVSIFDEKLRQYKGIQFKCKLLNIWSMYMTHCTRVINDLLLTVK